MLFLSPVTGVPRPPKKETKWRQIFLRTLPKSMNVCEDLRETSFTTDETPIYKVWFL